MDNRKKNMAKTSKKGKKAATKKSKVAEKDAAEKGADQKVLEKFALGAMWMSGTRPLCI